MDEMSPDPPPHGPPYLMSAPVIVVKLLGTLFGTEGRTNR